MTPEYGALQRSSKKSTCLILQTSLRSNKFDKRGAPDALRDVRKQYQRNHKLFDKPADSMPVVGSIASQFNDPGTTRLYRVLMSTIAAKTGQPLIPVAAPGSEESEKINIIPPERQRYLSRISDGIRGYTSGSRPRVISRISCKQYRKRSDCLVTKAPR